MGCRHHMLSLVRFPHDTPNAAPRAMHHRCARDHACTSYIATHSLVIRSPRDVAPSRSPAYYDPLRLTKSLSPSIFIETAQFFVIRTPLVYAHILVQTVPYSTDTRSTPPPREERSSPAAGQLRSGGSGVFELIYHLGDVRYVFPPRDLQYHSKRVFASSASLSRAYLVPSKPVLQCTAYIHTRCLRSTATALS